MSDLYEAEVARLVGLLDRRGVPTHIRPGNHALRQEVDAEGPALVDAIARRKDACPACRGEGDQHVEHRGARPEEWTPGVGTGE